ncbi:hypothetical protein tinsulaeT_24550 [Thalassotalea insulae]|uniref:DUF3450 family protein n=1 Tax=Thalassotalea insulae TaxID=2056778 RepID=A0ABQ6GWK9_9GAMM|nr:hypothetical protein [Thalassotalea insulae]GLX79115.1 hypothetical protein tinsulaeT_24550 [Thalassotalea insulae]
MLRPVLLSLILFLSLPLNAKANKLLISLNQLKEQIALFHTQQNDTYGEEYIETSVSYIQNVGAIFHLTYRQPLITWQQDNATSGNNEMAITTSQEEQKIKKKFVQLRQQAKSLSHQAYAIERKISAIEKSVNQSSNSAQTEQQLVQLKQKLHNIEAQKANLRPQYEKTENQLYQSQKSKQTVTSIPFTTQFAHFAAEQLCQQTAISPLITEHDKIIFILRATGLQTVLPKNNSRFEDTTYVITQQALSACENAEISTSELLQTFNIGAF